MRALIVASAICLLPLPAAAGEQTRVQTYGLGCTNTSDQQWAETVSGFGRLFGAEGRLVFSRDESSVTVTGGEGVQQSVATAARGLEDATCKTAAISYMIVALPAETDLGALLDAIRSADAGVTGPSSSLVTVPANARDVVLSQITGVPNAESISVGKQILNRRSATLKASHDGLGLSATLSPMIIGDTVTIDTAVEFTRPAGKGTHLYTNGNQFRMHSGQSELSVAQGPQGVLVTLVTAEVY